MNILIDIGHPGHVHLFKNIYFKLIQRQHKVFVSVRDIEIVKHLLNFYQIPYKVIGGKNDSLIGKALNVLIQDISLLEFVRKNKIEIGLSSGIVLSHLSKLTKMSSIMFDDDDDKVEPLIVKYGHPYTNVVLSPSTINRKSKKSISYSGTHELAYLHPKYFTPDENVIRELGISLNEKYFILRFVAFKGHHDVGQHGINQTQKRTLIELLSKYGKVFITAEREIEPEFESYRIPVPPEKIHSFMAFATMFLGDSQTMTSEAAVLGVPALKCNTFAGKLSVPNEIENKYQLCFSYQPDDFDKMIAKIKELLSIPNLKEEFQKRRKKMLADKIDDTAFMVWFVENYPESKKIMKENPDYQYKFK